MTAKKFLIVHILLTVVLLTTIYFVVTTKYGQEHVWAALFAGGLTSLSSLGAFFLTNSALNKSVKLFMSYMIGGMLIKFLAGLFSILILGLTGPRQTLVIYSITFLCCYFLFTIWEVFCLMQRNRIVTEAQKEAQTEKEDPSQPS